MMIKTISYATYGLEYQVECLEKLKECKFNRILIPKFDYGVFENVLTIHMQYIKGKQITLENRYKYKKIIYEDLVYSSNPISVMGYTIENFIVSREDNQLYFIDLEDIRFSTIEERKEKYNIDWVNEKPEIGL